MESTRQSQEMSKAEVPDEVRRFILTSIPSIPYLEALLLLRSQPAAAWDAPAIAKRLYIGENQAVELLHTMRQAGLAATTGESRFVFAPGLPELVRVVDDLAFAYSRDLVGVTRLVHSRMDRRAQQFADAFRWKRGGP